jgi:TolA-binding protein
MGKTHWEWALAAALCVAPLAGGAQEAGDPVFAAAQQLAVQKKYSDAAPALEKFLAAYPKHAKAQQARLALGEALLALDKPEPAAQAYLAVLNDRPAPDLKAEALMGLGRARLVLKQDAAAVETLAEVFTMTAQDSRNGPPASLLYGEALNRLGRHAEAARVFDRVQKWPEHPDAPRGHYLTGEAYRLAGNHLEAAVTLREVSQRHWRQPFAAQAGLSSGESYLAIKEYAEAEQEFRRVLKEYLESPAAPRAQLGLGHIAMATGSYGVARQAYQAAGLVFASAGIGPESELRMADTYLAEKNVDEARVRYQKLIASVDRKVAGEAWYTLAQTYHQAGDLGKAAETYQKLGGDRTTGRWAHRGLIRIAELQGGAGNADKAADALRAVLADQPERAIRDEAQLALGAMLLKQGQAAAAETELNAVAQRTPPGEHTHAAAALAAQCRLELADAAGALARTTPLLEQPLPRSTSAQAAGGRRGPA